MGGEEGSRETGREGEKGEVRERQEGREKRREKKGVGGARGRGISAESCYPEAQRHEQESPMLAK